MDVKLLIDAIVRQTTVLIAQLSTSAGIRAPLSHIADSCGACDHSAVYVVVANHGSARFAGAAVVSFDGLTADTPLAALPDPVTVSLELEPGAVSAPIRVESKAPVEVMIRVTADGDCQPLNDASTDVTLPSPMNDCPG